MLSAAEGTTVIAEMGLDVAAFIHFASVFCGDESLKLIGDKLPHTQMCISLEKGEKLMLYRVTSDGTEAVSAGSLAESAELTELITNTDRYPLPEDERDHGDDA